MRPTQSGVYRGCVKIEIQHLQPAEEIVHFTKTGVCPGDLFRGVYLINYSEPAAKLLFITHYRNNHFAWLSGLVLRGNFSVASLEQRDMVCVE